MSRLERNDASPTEDCKYIATLSYELPEFLERTRTGIVYKPFSTPYSPICDQDSARLLIRSQLSLANGMSMSRYTRLGPFMDPNVFRSSSHSHHNTRHDSLSPRQANADLSRFLYRDDYPLEVLDRQDGHYLDSCITHDYGSDRRHRNRSISSSRDIDDLVRRCARLETEQS